MTTVYKVVKNMGGALSSCSVYHNSKLCLVYKPDFWTVPKVGYIMAFSNHTYATRFMNFSPVLEIWTAEADIVEAWTLRILAISWSSKNHYEIVKKYWELVNNRMGLSNVEVVFNNSGVAPVGTVFCKRLKLIERIE